MFLIGGGRDHVKMKPQDSIGSTTSSTTAATTASTATDSTTASTATDSTTTTSVVVHGIPSEWRRMNDVMSTSKHRNHQGQRGRP